MTRIERAQQMRDNPARHYNCAQAVLLAFADMLPMDEEQMFALTAHCGGGLRHGGTCGAVVGALMALGTQGKTQEEVVAFLEKMSEPFDNTFVCATLVGSCAAKGVERKTLCDGLVRKAVELAEAELGL
jgi:Putative redox-active protein (C_GCAxxG_C_C).